MRTAPASAATGWGAAALCGALAWGTPIPASLAAQSGIPAPTPKIEVSRTVTPGGPTPEVRAAYAAFQSGDYASAARLYDRAASADPRSIDALLGQAAVAMHQGQADGARERYLAVLRLEPANAVAQGGLLALFGRADYASAELRLKELAARDPSAFLYQALGTLYAEQGLWPQAQHAYFHAHRLDAGNADHAYNLAVALEHIGQRATAASYYRRAVELARGRATPGFDVAQAERRAAQLTAAE